MSYEAKLSLLKQWEWEHSLLLEVQKEIEVTDESYILAALIRERTILYRKIQAAKADLQITSDTY